MAKKWKLNPSEIICLAGGSIGKSKGHPARTRRGLELTLIHQPTGTEVKRSVPEGPYSRKDMKKLKAVLYHELFPKLEQKVAKHLRIPGR